MNSCIISGASSGIGKSIAELLLKGNNLLGIDEIIAIGRNSTKLDELNNSRTSIRLKKLPLDLTNYHSNKIHLLNELKSRNSKKIAEVKYLICSAGVCNCVGNFDGLDFEKVVYEIHANFMGTLSLIHSLIHEFDKTGGHIVIISSPIGSIPTKNMAVYGSTKAALINFSEALKEELVDKKINVSCILPTLVNTDMAVHSPSPLIWPLEADYVATQIIQAIEKGHSGIKTIGIQALAATTIQKFSPFLNKWLIQQKSIPNLSIF